MAATYDIGDVIRASVAYLSTGSTAIDPSGVNFYLEPPDGTATQYIYNTSTRVVRASQGNYYFDITTTATGTYEYRWTSTGTAAGSQESWFFVRTQRVTT